MFSTQAEHDAFVARVRAAVDAEDLVTIGGLMGVAPDEVAANRDRVVAVMHKHRLAGTGVPDGERGKLFPGRRASFAWLKQRGHGDVRGEPLPATLEDFDARRP